MQSTTTDRSKSKICLYCLKDIDGLLTCTRCRTARYCGKTCQIKHWPVHKNICVDSNSENSNEKLEKKASNHFDQGNIAKSEKLYLKLLKNLNQTSEGNGDENHTTNTISAMNQLANIYSRQGRFHDAEQLYRELMGKCQKLLGKSDPWTLLATKSLARTLDALGRYDEAETLFHNCLKMMDPNDLAALDVQGDLASCLTNQNKLDLAVVLFLEVVQKKTLNFGETHDSTTSSRNNLGGVYLRMGQYSRAEELFKTSLRILKDTIGDTHPDYLSCSSRLGGVYTRCGRNAEAIALLSDVLEKQKRTVGYTKATLQTMTNLACAHERMGDNDKARVLRETCLQQQRALGGTDDDPLTQTMMLNYANSVVSLGRYAEAEVMYENVLKKQIQVLGERRPEVEITMKLLYRTYKLLGKDAKASKLLDRMASLFA